MGGTHRLFEMKRGSMSGENDCGFPQESVGLVWLKLSENFGDMMMQAMFILNVCSDRM